jgi:hypothetical protein
MGVGDPVIIPQGNWSTNVRSRIGTESRGNLDYDIIKAEVLPSNLVSSCNKPLFTASYKCGADTNLAPPLSVSNAWGKKVRFNCEDTFTKCSTLKLTLDDTGVLTVTDRTGNKLWNSDSPVINPLNPPLALAQYAAASSAPAPNRYSQNSFISSGDYLNIGQWIGSPSGKFRLEMVTVPASAASATSAATNTLQVVYNVLGCSGEAELNSASSNLYSIPSIHKENVGKVGFVNEFGQLQPYPTTSPTYDLSAGHFESIGNYGVYGGDLPGGAPETDTNDCETQCISLGDTCVGFVKKQLSNGDKLCELKGQAVLNSGKRFVNNNYEYYVRTLQVSPDISCPQTIETEDASTWASLSSDMSGNMTSTTKCGLNLYTAQEQLAKTTALNVLTENAANSTGMMAYVTGLYSRYQTLKNNLLNTKTELDASFNDLEKSKQGLEDWSGEQLAQLEALDEDRELNMNSQRYKHIMWAILAIVIVISIIISIMTMVSSTKSPIASITSSISNALPTMPTLPTLLSAAK